MFRIPIIKCEPQNIQCDAHIKQEHGIQEHNKIKLENTNKSAKFDGINDGQYFYQYDTNDFTYKKENVEVQLKIEVDIIEDAIIKSFFKQENFDGVESQIENHSTNIIKELVPKKTTELTQQVTACKDNLKKNNASLQDTEEGIIDIQETYKPKTPKTDTKHSTDTDTITTSVNSKSSDNTDESLVLKKILKKNKEKEQGKYKKVKFAVQKEMTNQVQRVNSCKAISKKINATLQYTEAIQETHKQKSLITGRKQLTVLDNNIITTPVISKSSYDDDESLLLKKILKKIKKNNKKQLKKYKKVELEVKELVPKEMTNQVQRVTSGRAALQSTDKDILAVQEIHNPIHLITDSKHSIVLDTNIIKTNVIPKSSDDDNESLLLKKVLKKIKKKNKKKRKIYKKVELEVKVKELLPKETTKQTQQVISSKVNSKKINAVLQYIEEDILAVQETHKPKSPITDSKHSTDIDIIKTTVISKSSDNDDDDDDESLILKNILKEIKKKKKKKKKKINKYNKVEFKVKELIPKETTKQRQRVTSCKANSKKNNAALQSTD